MKNSLTQWKIKEENQKTNGNMPLIDREHSSNVLLIDDKHSSNVLFIDSKHNGNLLFIDRNLQNWKIILNVHLF